MTILFVFAGTEAQFRALSPSPTSYWGRWHGVEIGSAFFGVIEADTPSIRNHTHANMTFLPTHGSNVLSADQVSACAALEVSITTGDTVYSAVEKIHAVNSVSFLHPDNF